MNADIIADKDKYNDWDNPYYQAGYLSGCETKPYVTDYLAEDKAYHIKELKEAVATIKKLEEKANDLNNTLDYLIRENNRPWYIKLWSKIPKISIQITRR